MTDMVDGLDNGIVHRIVYQFAGKVAVNLDVIHWQAAEVTEGAQATTKVIQGKFGIRV